MSPSWAPTHACIHARNHHEYVTHVIPSCSCESVNYVLRDVRSSECHIHCTLETTRIKLCTSDRQHREGSRLGKVAPAERCIEGPGVGTCKNSLANASPRGMQLVRVPPLPSAAPPDLRRALCQESDTAAGLVRPDRRSSDLLACRCQARR